MYDVRCVIKCQNKTIACFDNLRNTSKVLLFKTYTEHFKTERISISKFCSKTTCTMYDVRCVIKCRNKTVTCFNTFKNTGKVLL